MEKKTPLLDEIGRKHGMKVPGNYFADFTEKMTESLPEREFPELVQPSLWLRVRPWIYMAAMFAGIWLMMKMFTGIFSVEKGETRYGNDGFGDRWKYDRRRVDRLLCR